MSGTRGNGGSGALVSWLWSMVILAVAASIAAHLLLIYVVPLLPYLAAAISVVVVGYAAHHWLNRRW